MLEAFPTKTGWKSLTSIAPSCVSIPEPSSKNNGRVGVVESEASLGDGSSSTKDSNEILY